MAQAPSSHAPARQRSDGSNSDAERDIVAVAGAQAPPKASAQQPKSSGFDGEADDAAVRLRFSLEGESAQQQRLPRPAPRAPLPASPGTRPGLQASETQADPAGSIASRGAIAGASRAADAAHVPASARQGLRLERWSWRSRFHSALKQSPSRAREHTSSDSDPVEVLRKSSPDARSARQGQHSLSPVAATQLVIGPQQARPGGAGQAVCQSDPIFASTGQVMATAARVGQPGVPNVPTGLAVNSRMDTAGHPANGIDRSDGTELALEAKSSLEEGEIDSFGDSDSESDGEQQGWTSLDMALQMPGLSPQRQVVQAQGRGMDFRGRGGFGWQSPPLLVRSTWTFRPRRTHLPPPRRGPERTRRRGSHRCRVRPRAPAARRCSDNHASACGIPSDSGGKSYIHSPQPRQPPLAPPRLSLQLPPPPLRRLMAPRLATHWLKTRTAAL